jgi:hypothetical protein
MKWLPRSTSRHYEQALGKRVGLAFLGGSVLLQTGSDHRKFLILRIKSKKKSPYGLLETRFQARKAPCKQ